MRWQTFCVAAVFAVLLSPAVAGPASVGVCYTACNTGYVSW